MNGLPEDALGDSQPLTASIDKDHEKNVNFKHPWIDSTSQIRLLSLAEANSDPLRFECALEIANITQLQNVRYDTLSYQWGEARTDKDIHEIYVDHQPFWVRTNLWTFLQSVRNFDVQVPIYIDAICLNQLDHAERGEQVKLMSQVYSNADCTHVWLGLPHAEQAISLHSLRTQLTDNAPLPAWRTESFVALSYMCSREYWRRLWIVQELLLSELTILHCGPFTFQWDELVRFARSGLLSKDDISGDLADFTWWDAWDFPKPEDYSQQLALENRLHNGWHSALRLFHYRESWRSRTATLGQPCYVQPQPVGFPFHQAMVAFGRQQCWDLKDRVYALVGLLDSEGRDFITPNYRSSLQEVFIEAAAAAITSHWRRDSPPRGPPSTKPEIVMFCGMLNASLGLSIGDIEARISAALRVAVAYANNLRTETSECNVGPMSFRDRPPINQEVAQTAARFPGVEHGPALKSPLQQAFEDFKCGLTRLEIQEFANTTVTDLKGTIAAIQEEQRATGTMQNMTRLKAFLNTTEGYGEILSICVAEQNAVVYIWGSMKHLLQVARKRSDTFDGLLSQYEAMGDSLPNISTIKLLPEGSGHRSEVVGVLFRNIFEFHTLALRYFKNPAWQQLLASTWHQLKMKLSAFSQDMVKHKELVNTQANAQELDEAREGRQANVAHFSELLEHAKQARVEADENFGRLNADEVDRRKVLLFKWLSAPDSASDLDHHQLHRHSGSGQWLLRNARFRAWFEPHSVSAPMLWITGKPGAGKSVLASLVFDQASQLSNTSTLVFFCKQDDKEKNCFVGMARSILAQLLKCKCDDELSMYLFEAVIKRGETTLRTIKMAKEMLTICLKAVGKTYVVIDGIDECDSSEQQQIAKFWMSYVERSSSSRCVILSQDDALTNPMFCKLPTVRIDGMDHDKDIATYCKEAVEQFPQELTLKAHEKAGIASETTRRAKGMFLFARLVMKNLSEQVTRADFDMAMAPGVFPEGLEDAYNRILDRILKTAHKPYHRYARKLLQWISCATRPLKWREIQAAVSIDLDRGQVDFERLRILFPWKTLLGALVEESSNGDMVFVHSTVKTHLLHHGYVDIGVARSSLTNVCLDYFSLPAFSEACTDDALRVATLTGTYAFIEYALVSWTSHLECVLEDLPLPESLAEALQRFFDLHWKKPTKKTKPTKRIRELTDRLTDHSLHARIRDSMSAMHSLMSTNSSNMDSVYTLEIFAILARIRSIMEDLALNLNESASLTQFYGDKLFKCPRIYCKWFHEGFSTQEERDSHVEKHERSHYCLEAGCVFATFGYPTAKELEKHVTDTHQMGLTEEEFPEIIDESDAPEEDQYDLATIGFIEALTSFQPSDDVELATAAQVPDAGESSGATRDLLEQQELRPTIEFQRSKRRNESSEANERGGPTRQRRTDPSIFQCHLCPKKFTRRFTLTSHLRIHSNERPFACKICGKSFARARDCKRHEDSHDWEKQLVCHGILRTGRPWGCRKRFSRPDAFHRHFRSDMGRACIQPVRDEEARPMRHLSEPLHDNNAVATRSGYNTPTAQMPDSVNHELPTALLERFPALATVDWESSERNAAVGSSRHVQLPSISRLLE